MGSRGCDDCLGCVNSAIPVCWSTWLATGISDEPESGGGLLIAGIQLSIMLGAAFGGLLLDHIAVGATLVGGTVMLVLAALTIGNGDRLRPGISGDNETSSGFIEARDEPAA